MSKDPAEFRQPFTDEELLHAHEAMLEDKVDDRGHYKLTPLILLFLFAGLIFAGGTYVNEFSGRFDARIHNEHAVPVVATGPVEEVNLVEFGEKQYAVACASCHAPAGVGAPPIFPPLAGSEWVTGPDARLVRIILHGLTGPITVKGQTFGVGPTASAMPAGGTAGASISDLRVAAIATYIRQAWGNQAAEVPVARVTEIRAAGARATPWTAAELEGMQ